MKKAIALISAAVLIFTVAGCANKQQQLEQTQAAPQSTGAAPQEESSTKQEETAVAETQTTGTTLPPTSATAVVIVTGGVEYGIQQPDKTSVVQLLTTIAPPPTRPLTRPSTAVRPTTAKMPQATTTRRPSTTAYRTTTAVTTVGTTAAQSTTAAFNPPQVIYAPSYTVGEGAATDSIKFASHTCMLRENGSIGIMINVDVLQFSGTRSGITVTYNCYDKAGNRLNEQPLNCRVLLQQGQSKTIATAVAAKGTVKVEFVSCK